MTTSLTLRDNLAKYTCKCKRGSHVTCGGSMTSSMERYTGKIAQDIIDSLMPRDHANGQVTQ